MRKILIFTILIITICLSIYFLIILEIKIYKVASSSMEPVIKMGSLVFVIAENEYRIGDIVTYKTPQNTTPITHRIIRIFLRNNTYYFVLKGDRNNEEDMYPVVDSELTGKVVLVVPFLGSLPNVLLSYKTVWLTIYLPLGFLLGKKLAKLFNES